MNGIDLIPFAKGLVGRKYLLGAYVPKNNQEYKGSFDCAEFISYILYQKFNILYGTELNTFSRKLSDDAYTGYFDRDANKKGNIISINQSARTPGALLLRVGIGSSIGHIALSQGNGKTIEAHSTKYGVCESKVDGRRWSYGILIPGIQYEELPYVISKPPIIVYRLKSPYMRDAYIGKIQVALGLNVDNIFGRKTQDAIVAYQKKKGLTPDGEVMPGGETSKSLKL